MANKNFLETGCYASTVYPIQDQERAIIALARHLDVNITGQRAQYERNAAIIAQRPGDDEWAISEQEHQADLVWEMVDQFNASPLTPADAYWGFVDGDFGMWSVHDD
jgi:hypothetical protein